MPVYAIGLNENVTPFSFANVAPPLKFRWMIANDQVALLRPVYQEVGIIQNHNKKSFLLIILAMECE